MLIFVPGSCSILLSARAHFCSRLVLIFVLGSCSLLLGNHRSYPFSLSNRCSYHRYNTYVLYLCSYARPTGPPYLSVLNTASVDFGCFLVELNFLKISRNAPIVWKSIFFIQFDYRQYIWRCCLPCVYHGHGPVCVRGDAV